MCGLTHMRNVRSGCVPQEADVSFSGWTGKDESSRDEKIFQDHKRNGIHHGPSGYGMYGFGINDIADRDVIRWTFDILLRDEDDRRCVMRWKRL